MSLIAHDTKALFGVTLETKHQDVMRLKPSYCTISLTNYNISARRQSLEDW